MNRIEEDLEDIVSLVQDGDVDAIKSLSQSLIREYIGNYPFCKMLERGVRSEYQL